jgi:hypothetical protein
MLKDKKNRWREDVRSLHVLLNAITVRSQQLLLLLETIMIVPTLKTKLQNSQGSPGEQEGKVIFFFLNPAMGLKSVARGESINGMGKQEEEQACSEVPQMVLGPLVIVLYFSLL